MTTTGLKRFCESHGLETTVKAERLLVRPNAACEFMDVTGYSLRQASEWIGFNANGDDEDTLILPACPVAERSFSLHV